MLCLGFHILNRSFNLQRFSLPKMSASDKQPGDVGGGDRPVEGGGGAAGGQDPKNVAELTNYIQSMLQQMQDRSFRA